MVDGNPIRVSSRIQRLRKGVGGQKGLADRGGWHKEIPPMPWIRAFFLHPFSYAPFCCILGAVGRQPLFETSDTFGVF